MLADTAGLQKPIARRLVIGPIPFPRAMVGTARIDLRVSEDGKVIADSIWIEGVPDAEYERRLRQTVQGYLYFPSVLNGCAVSARTWTRVGPSDRR